MHPDPIEPRDASMITRCDRSPHSRFQGLSFPPGGGAARGIAPRRRAQRPGARLRASRGGGSPCPAFPDRDACTHRSAPNTGTAFSRRH